MSTMEGLRWACWPEHQDLLLLQAAAHRDDAAAAEAWARLRDHLDVDRPTADQYRLLPLLAARLAITAPDDPLLGLLRGIARRHTVHSLVLLRALVSPLQVLREAGIEPVVLKGPALAVLAYDHVGQRPFDDVDLLVPPGHHVAAQRALEAAGWQACTVDFAGNHAVPMKADTTSGTQPDTAAQAGNAAPALEHMTGAIDVDLHRHLNRELVRPGRHDATWALLDPRTAPAPLPDGTPFTTLSVAGHLVHAVVHGTQLLPGPRPTINLRWVADASHLVDREVDWDQVQTLAAHFGVAAVMADGLTLLEHHLGTPVEPGVVAALRSIRNGPLSMARVRAFRVPATASGRLGGLPRTTAVFLQRTSDRGAVATARSIPQFLADAWSLEGPRQLPGEVWRRSRDVATGSRAGSVEQL